MIGYVHSFLRNNKNNFSEIEKYIPPEIKESSEPEPYLLFLFLAKTIWQNWWKFKLKVLLREKKIPENNLKTFFTL